VNDCGKELMNYNSIEECGKVEVEEEMVVKMKTRTKVEVQNAATKGTR
jgi:hypothetical protein